MSETGKRKRRSRKTKEEKALEKLAKEQQAKEEEQGQEQQEGGGMPNPSEEEYQNIKQIINQNENIRQQMVDMDVRIKYGFIKTLHNNLISINNRFNWNPEELMSIGMLFNDFKNIETMVYNTVMQQSINNEIEEEEEEEEVVEEEPEEEDVN